MTTDPAASKKSQDAEHRGIQVFHASDGEALTENIMPMEGLDESVLAGFGKMAEAGAAESSPEKVRCLFREPGENGLSLCYAWFKSGFVLPRHSHNADCLYYIVGGELKLGNQTLKNGDGFFVPSDQYYSYVVGPEGVEVLEFRNATRFNIFFKPNDDKHWDRAADATREHGPKWAEETTPPSERQTG